MENKNYIRFRENYAGKLDKEVFTTIRPDDPARYQVGQLYDIYLNDKKLHKVIMTKLHVVTNLNDIPLNIIKNDTGLDTMEDFIKLLTDIYGNINEFNWVILILRKV